MITTKKISSAQVRKISTVKTDLLNAAIELLKENGPASATARAICDKVGVKQPALYHYYGHLDALHQAAVEAVFEQFAALYEPANKAGSPVKSIRNSWEQLCQFAYENPKLYKILNVEIIDGWLPPSVEEAFNQMVADLQTLDEVNKLNIEPMKAAQVLWAAGNGAATLMASARFHKEVDTSVPAAILDGLLKALVSEEHLVDAGSV